MGRYDLTINGRIRYSGDDFAEFVRLCAVEEVFDGVPVRVKVEKVFPDGDVDDEGDVLVWVEPFEGLDDEELSLVADSGWDKDFGLMGFEVESEEWSDSGRGWQIAFKAEHSVRAEWRDLDDVDESAVVPAPVALQTKGRDGVTTWLLGPN